MSGTALDTFLRAEELGSPYEAAYRPAREGAALRQFRADERRGSPIEAALLGRPVNGDARQVGGQERPQFDGSAGYDGDLAELHARMIQWFEAAERASADARAASERDRDYKDGLQLDAETLAALKKRGQPPLVDNFIRDKVELLSGMERKSRSDPKAYPRTPAEEDRADAATQALRYIGDDTNFPMIRSHVYENMLVEGYGGAELGIEDDGRGGANITITHVGWERLWHDPHSRALDFSDARHLGMVLWMDRAQLRDMFPDAADVVGDSFAPMAGTYDDRPGTVAWQDGKRERCRVLQVYWQDGADWWGATVSRAGFLAEPQRSVFLDRRGRSACPLILQGAYIDRHNNRYGVVRDLISGQDAINKRQSKALHLLSVNRVIAERGAVDDVDAARKEVAKPDGFIEVNPGMKFEVAPAGELASGQFQLLQIAMQRMQAKGPNAAMSGTDPRDQSGRAILAQQAGGAAANEPLVDGLRQWSRRVYEMAWMAARQYWTGEKFLRVTDDMGDMKWIGLNRKVTVADELKAMPDDQRAVAMQSLRMVPNDPRLQVVVRTENEIADLDVDITIEEGNDIPALQAEQFTALMQLAGSQPGIIPPDVLIMASSLKDKAKLVERMEQAKEAGAQAQAQQQAARQAMLQADVRGKNAQASANEALALERVHGAAHSVASVHKMAAESPGIPVGPPVAPPDAGGFRAE